MSLVVLAVSAMVVLQSLGSDLAVAEAARLESCIAKIETDPENAYEDGLTWSYQGNRPGARQCTALALIALGSVQEGAERLEALANAADGGTLEQRAVYLSQAGNAWLQGGVPDAAVTSFSNALKILPATPDLLIDRASAHLMAERWDAAIADLDAALGATPARAIALQMRAEAYLGDGNPERALGDVEAAMKADPKNIDTLVVRGRVREAIRVKTAAPAR